MKSKRKILLSKFNVKAPLGIESLPLYYFITTILTYCFTYETFPIQWELIVYSALICTYPILFREYKNYVKNIIYLSLLLIILGLTLNEYALIITVPLAIIGILYSLLSIYYNINLEQKKIIGIIGIILFAFISFYDFIRIGSVYVNPHEIVNLSILNGIFETDASFHISIINMILNNGYPSTGLHFTPYLPYHTFSHYIHALFKLLSGLQTYEIFYLMNVFIIVPFLLHSLLFIFTSFNKTNINALIFLPLVFFGVILELNTPWYRMDISTTFSIVLTYFIIAAIYTRTKVSIILFLILLSFFAKVSTGFVLSLAYLGVLILNDQSWAKKLITIVSLIIITKLSLYFINDSYMVNNNLNFDLFSFYKYVTFSQEKTVLLFIWTYWAIPILLILLSIYYSIFFLNSKQHFFEKVKNNYDIIIFISCVYIAGISANFFTLPNGSHVYFVIISSWISLPFLSILIYKILKNNNFYYIRILPYMLVLLLILSTSNLIIDRFKSYKKFIETKDDKIFTLTEHYKKWQKNKTYNDKTNFEKYFQALRFIANNYSEKNYLVEIPESESDFWNHTIYPYPRYWMPFYIPVFAEKPAFNGYSFFMKDKRVAWYKPGAYGYSTYYNQPNNIDYCTNTKYEGRFIIKKQNNVLNIIQLPCNNNSLIVIKSFKL